MISRNWIGIAKKERANEYVQHLQNETFEEIKKIKGFTSSRILQREVSEGVEFLIITEWENIEAIKQFAGEQFNIAVVPHLVKEIMISYQHEVKHYTVV